MSKTFEPEINPHEKAKEGARIEKGGHRNLLREAEIEYEDLEEFDSYYFNDEDDFPFPEENDEF